MSASTSNPITINAAVGVSPVYKGKALRSWAELPEEVVRLIATYYLLDITASTYIPNTWEARRLWQGRMVYTAIRDSLNIEKHLMFICLSWRRAIEKHFFWNHIVNIIDPNDFLLFHMTVHPKPQHENASTIAAPIRLTYHHHLKNVIASSCVVCRINYPTSTMGLATAKRSMITSYLGTLGICKDHDRRRASYCGLCLRDTVVTGGPDTTARDYELSQAIAIVENEDEETWPSIDSTCKKCRVEWLWRRANHSVRDREAIGGSSLQSGDWETRQTVENFIELGEGTIGEVLALAREKQWLRLHTKYEGLGQHMLAAQVTHQRSEAAHVRREEEEEDSEEDREAMMTRGSGQVRDLSLTAWARERILDGHWISPADIYYSNTALGHPLVVSTIHPLPWAREVDPQSESNEEEQHPTSTTIAAEAPPTYALCEQAYLAHMKAMREILGPPMRNLVRKLVMECSVPTERGFEDPAHRARKMSLADVLKVLREEEGVWYDGVDWVEKKRNEEETSRRRRLEAEAVARSAPKEDDSDSTTSSSSSGSAKSSNHGSSSNATSPVLSTTTLQTTPSPPPIVDEGVEVSTPAKKEQEPGSPPVSNVRQESRILPPPPPPQSQPRFIPVDPVRSTPRLLSAIPYVPVTPCHLPSYSFEALRTAWREACAPLYHCSCTVCERAKVAEMNARAAYAALSSVVPSQPQAVNPSSRGVIYPPSNIRSIDASEIELKEVHGTDLDGDGEEEVDYDSELEYGDDDEDADEEIDEDDDPNNPRYEIDEADYRFTPSPEPEPRARKRSSDELEDELEEVLIENASDTPSFRRPDRREQGGTPPKRARIGDDGVTVHSAEEDHSGHEHLEETVTSRLQPTPISSPSRMRKRNSEELEDGDVAHSTLSNKRVKVDCKDPLVESPASIGYSSLDGEALPEEGNVEPEDTPYFPPGQRRVSKADIDTLIALEDANEGGT